MWDPPFPYYFHATPNKNPFQVMGMVWEGLPASRGGEIPNLSPQDSQCLLVEFHIWFFRSATTVLLFGKKSSYPVVPVYQRCFFY